MKRLILAACAAAALVCAGPVLAASDALDLSVDDVMTLDASALVADVAQVYVAPDVGLGLEGAAPALALGASPLVGGGGLDVAVAPADVVADLSPLTALGWLADPRTPDLLL